MMMFWRIGLVGALMVGMGLAAWGQAGAGQKAPPASVKSPDAADKAQTGAAGGLVIEPEELPGTYPHGAYRIIFHARGNYVPVLQWKLESGTLPPGIRLEENGELHGEALRAGEFQFVISVRDGNQPRQAVQKEFTIKVVEGLTVVWKVPAHVNANRIEGSVEVSNSTADDVDLTFDVKAVNENGRATEIGYQHFPLTPGTIGVALPFGETLPNGAYMIYVDVNGEVAKRNAIYKQELKTGAALQVVVGP